LVKNYPILKLQFGAYKDSAVFSALNHESCQLQIMLNFYYLCKCYPKSRSLNSTLSFFQALQPQLPRSLNRSVSSLQVFQPRVYVFSPSPSFLQKFQSKLYVSQLISLLYLSAPNFTSLNSSLSSIQVLQTLRLSTQFSPLFKCSKFYVSQLISLLYSSSPNFTSLNSSLSSI
jgi:hypothetical protein